MAGGEDELLVPDVAHHADRAGSTIRVRSTR